MNRIKENDEWISGFENNIGPFQEKYQGLVAEIGQLYGEAKEKHAKGIQVRSPVALVACAGGQLRP